MKKTIILFAVFLLYIFAFAEKPKSYFEIKSNNISDIVPKKFHVTGSVTLSGGCVVQYNLTLDVSLIPPGLNSLSGTLTLSGNCTGAQTIHINGKGEFNENNNMEIEFDEQIFESTETELEFKNAFNEVFNSHSSEIFSGSDEDEDFGEW